MRMQKIQFRIGELAKHLNVEKFVIRFWEKEFNLSTNRSDGGQRFYNEDDVHQFKQIKELLYEKGFTIAGAKKALTSHEFKSDSATVEQMPTEQAPINPINACSKTTLLSPEKQVFIEQLSELKKQLVALNKLL